jgi:hypothetical protein
MAWQRAQLPLWRAEAARPPHCQNVTALAYFFWDDDRIDALFYTIEAAFRAAWSQCGRLRSKLVVNRTTPQIARFCGTEGVSLDIERRLCGGLRSLSHDCITELHRRFDTEFVLIVQNDGFPIRRGLAEFVGPYDYIGAPWPQPTWYTGAIFPYPAYNVGNGGFSLRSKRICELAAWHYRRRYRLIPASWFTTEDVFYARVLRRCEPDYRRRMAFAPLTLAAQFAVERDLALCKRTEKRPFGFHGADAFAYLQRNQSLTSS